MQIRDLMTCDVVHIQENAFPREALDQFQKYGFHHLVVIDDCEQIVGMLSYNDLRPLVNHLASGNDSSQSSEISAVQLYNVGRVKDLMSSDVVFVAPEEDISKVAKVMLEKRIHSLPVIEREALVGIITDTDILKAVAEKKLRSQSE